MRLEPKKQAFIAISSVCVVALLITRNYYHFTPRQLHTDDSALQQTLALQRVVPKFIKSEIKNNSRGDFPLRSNEQHIATLQAVHEGQKSIDVKDDIMDKASGSSNINEMNVISNVHRKDSTPKSKEIQSFPHVVDSFNNNNYYKNGFLKEHICCKSLPGSISDIAMSCLEKTNQVEQLKLKKMSPECSCVDYFMCRLVVVSGFSSNHFKEAQDMIASIQHNLPDTKLIVYDLGLYTHEKELVQNYCNVEYRSFNFSQYPSHARNLRTYAFKPLIVNEISKEYEVIMWADASVRVMQPIASTLFPYFGVFPFLSGPLYSKPLPIVSTTHDGMLQYLNISQSREKLSGFNTLQACNWIIWLNKLMRDKLLKHWVNCALHLECIAPKGSRRSPCKIENGTKKSGEYFNCHRYDQSALNFILIREFGLDIWDSVYHKEVETVLNIKRSVTNHFTPAATAPCQHTMLLKLFI